MVSVWTLIFWKNWQTSIIYNHINKRGIYNKHARYTECPMSNCQKVGVISTYIIEIPNAKAVVIPKRKPVDCEIIL